MSKQPYNFIDKNRRIAKPGDLIRVYHYTDVKTRRKCYMYKLIVLVTDDFQISHKGRYMYCVDIPDIWKNEGMQNAHKCSLSSVGEFEIIDGLSEVNNGVLKCWYERQKRKV